MNDIELAKLFVEYSETKAKLAELAMYIETAVLEKGESVKLAGITASFYKPSIDTDYETAAKSVMPDDFDLLPYSSIKPTVRWKDVCEVLVADVGLFITEKPARVVIK